MAALRLLKQSELEDVGIIKAVKYCIDHYRPAKNRVSVSDAADKYIEFNRERLDDDLISADYERSFRVALNHFRRAHGDMMMEQVTSEVVTDWIKSMNSGSPAPKTWNNARGYMSKFCKFCIMENMLCEDPVFAVEQRNPNRQLKQIEVAEATVLQAFFRKLDTEELNGFPPGSLCVLYALLTFAGIRPSIDGGEITRVEIADINLKSRMINLVASKTKNRTHGRHIHIQPNLYYWLERYLPTVEHILPPQPKKLRDLMRELRAEFGLGQNVLRHTFITNHVATFNSVGNTAIQAGNSEAVIKVHYLGLMDYEGSFDFWGIVPRDCDVGPLKPTQRGLLVEK